MAFVTLDISGNVVKTRVSTLTSVKGAFFDKLLKETDGDFSGLLDKAGNLFLDRDFKTFSIVLGYLRDGASFPLPEDYYELRKLRHEAVFLNLPELVALVDYRTNPRDCSGSTVDELNAYDFADCGCDRTCQKAASPPPPRPEKPKPKPILKPNGRSKERRRTTSIKPKGNVDFDGRDLSSRTESSEEEAADKPKLIDLPTPPKSPLKKHNGLIPSCIRPQSIAISSPNNFTHVVHIGWQENVKRMVVDSNAVISDPSLKQILKAAEDPEKLQQPVYSMIDDQDESIEVFFSGQSMKQRRSSRAPTFESRPRRNRFRSRKSEGIIFTKQKS
ncbi:hypothetical protein L596_024381 [Steinernema carpocapsae]|uniref:CRIB domain-containing protein n=1 Tax=Steinernema carpocapsae TaxID=34508 RepID=A0A4U5MGK9_STECR|nr:hypothetical protein L596_024381 [Steinernema carpocapsae]